MQEALYRRIIELPGITVGRSLVSLPDARAFHLDAKLAHGPRSAFQRGTEFAHIHAAYDGSLHLTLPPALYDRVLETGWGEPHPVSGTMMLFGPRTGDELDIVWGIVRKSYHYATTAPVEQSAERRP
ncbi:MAG TPA: luciferase family protein [Acidimicrobiia bacterium]|nr:luciferase family protein [Acidimicrobiia bacterium]